MGLCRREMVLKAVGEGEMGENDGERGGGGDGKEMG